MSRLARAESKTIASTMFGFSRGGFMGDLPYARLRYHGRRGHLGFASITESFRMWLGPRIGEPRQVNQLLMNVI